MSHNLKLFGIAFMAFIYGLGFYMLGHQKGYQLAENFYSPASQTRTAQPTPTYFTGQELFDAVNGYRKSKGIAEVKLDQRFCNNLVARWQALNDPEKLGHGDLHTWAQEWLPGGVTYQEVFAGGSKPQDLIDAWVTSPGHRLVIEDPSMVYGCAYAAEGTGVVIFGHF